MELAPTITRTNPTVQPDGTDKVQALMAAIAQAQRQYSLDYVWTLTIRTITPEILPILPPPAADLG
jgi:hypothetical protein